MRFDNVSTARTEYAMMVSAITQAKKRIRRIGTDVTVQNIARLAREIYHTWLLRRKYIAKRSGKDPIVLEWRFPSQKQFEELVQQTGVMQQTEKSQLKLVDRVVDIFLQQAEQLEAGMKRGFVNMRAEYFKQMANKAASGIYAEPSFYAFYVGSISEEDWELYYQTILIPRFKGMEKYSSNLARRVFDRLHELMDAFYAEYGHVGHHFEIVAFSIRRKLQTLIESYYAQDKQIGLPSFFVDFIPFSWTEFPWTPDVAENLRDSFDPDFYAYQAQCILNTASHHLNEVFLRRIFDTDNLPVRDFLNVWGRSSTAFARNSRFLSMLELQRLAHVFLQHRFSYEEFSRSSTNIFDRWHEETEDVLFNANLPFWAHYERWPIFFSLDMEEIESFEGIPTVFEKQVQANRDVIEEEGILPISPIFTFSNILLFQKVMSMYVSYHGPRSFYEFQRRSQEIVKVNFDDWLISGDQIIADRLRRNLVENREFVTAFREWWPEDIEDSGLVFSDDILFADPERLL